MKYLNLFLIFSTCAIILDSCSQSYLDVLPEDKIAEPNFWENESDVKMTLDGIYSVLRAPSIYGYGPGLDAMTSNAYQWTPWEGNEQLVGNGSLTTSTDGIVSDRWTQCYNMIYRANYFLENIDEVEDIDPQAKLVYEGEARFLRGIAYSLLADSYGGVPIIDSTITVDEAREVERAGTEETWNQVISDYNFAIDNLPVTATEIGRATLGAALGMKMRAYLYQNKYDEVLKVINSIDSLGIYSLFPSYHGLFQVANENNQEVLFDVQFIDGQNGQGNDFDLNQPQNLKFGISGANSVAPIQDLVDDYYMENGKPITDVSSGFDPNKPYEGRDPRLDFTVLRPGAYFQDQLYPDEIKNHTGQRVGFGLRKYTDEVDQVIIGQSPLNFIVLRYADVILAKAEAIIETGGDIGEAVDLINKIRTEREDVQISPLSSTISREEAQSQLRHERRIEFAMEGTYWSDIRRWDIGDSIYPLEVRAGDGSLIETKFPNGYNERYNLLPIPEDQRSLNPNLDPNPGW